MNQRQPSTTTTAPERPFDGLIAIDRSDLRLDLRFGEAVPQLDPEALSRRFGGSASCSRTCAAVIFAQPAEELLAFFRTHDAVVYAIHPKTLARFREAFRTSRCKDDGLDCPASAFDAREPRVESHSHLDLRRRLA